MHATMTEEEMEKAYDNTFCLVLRHKPTPKTKLVMAKILKRMFSDQGDKNLQETFDHHDDDIFQPSDGKDLKGQLVIRSFEVQQVLYLKNVGCVGEEMGFYEGIMAKTNWDELQDFGKFEQCIIEMTIGENVIRRLSGSSSCVPNEDGS